MFFFKQKTAYELRMSDWSSAVGSSDLPEGEYVARVDRLHVRGVVLGRQQRRAEEIFRRAVAIRGHAAVELRPLAGDDDPLAGDRLVARIRRDRFEFGDRLRIAVFARLRQPVLQADPLVVAHVDDLAEDRKR